MSGKKIEIQQDHVIVENGETVPAGYVGLLAKVDGFYEKLPGEAEKKLRSAESLWKKVGSVLEPFDASDSVKIDVPGVSLQLVGRASGEDAIEDDEFVTKRQLELIEDISFEFRDIEDGTAIVYVLDIKASYAYTILSAILACDAGTVTGMSIKINGVAVTSLSAVTVTDTTTETAATALNVVAVGDRITLTGTGITGAATTLLGKLKIQRNG